MTNIAVVKVAKASMLIDNWGQFGTKLLNLVRMMAELIEQRNKRRGGGVTVRVRQAYVTTSRGALTSQQQ